MHHHTTFGYKDSAAHQIIVWKNPDTRTSDSTVLPRPGVYPVQLHCEGYTKKNLHPWSRLPVFQNRVRTKERKESVCEAREWELTNLWTSGSQHNPFLSLRGRLQTPCSLEGFTAKRINTLRPEGCRTYRTLLTHQLVVMSTSLKIIR